MARLLVALAAVFTLATSAVPAVAGSLLEGNWSGSGYVQPSNGAREKVTCRVNYHQLNDTVHAVKATCATASLKIVQTGEVSTVREGRYIGDFANAEYNVSGSIRVVVNGNTQSVTFTSASGGGTLALKRR